MSRARPAWLVLPSAAALAVGVFAASAPGEECRRTCAPDAPRDSRGCCVDVLPARGGKAPAAASAGKAPGTWVRVKAGSFVMGSPQNEVAHDDDEHEHRVTLTHDFLLLDSEVTQGDFQRLMGYNPADFASCGADCPVETVSWHEAAAYANALSDLEGLERCYACTGQQAAVACVPSDRFVKPYRCPGYRLPTEAEWEYAARSGTTTATYGGDLTPAGLACEQPNLALDRIAWFCGNSGQSSRPVKGRDPSAWALYDMLGNVYEWCHDLYGPYGRSARTDPWGAESGSERVVRGGSWCCSHNRDVRAAERMSEPPGERHSAMGFRPARTVL